MGAPEGLGDDAGIRSEIRYPLFLGTKKKDSHPVCQGDYSASGFVRWLEGQARFSGGKEGPYCLAVTPLDPANFTRSAANIAEVHVMGFDVDQGESWDIVSDRLEAQGVAYCAYPSYNHLRPKPLDKGGPEPARDRWRAFVFLAEPICGENYKTLYPIIADHLIGPGNWDRAASDASRLWYVPFVHPGKKLELVDRSERTPFDVYSVVASLGVESEDKVPSSAKKGGGSPWDDFSRSVDLEQLRSFMEGDDWKLPVRCADGYRITRPGKDHGTSAIIHATGIKGAWVHVFTSSAPIPAGSYSAFSYVCLARFNNDFKTCLEWAKGYMRGRGIAFDETPCKSRGRSSLAAAPEDLAEFEAVNGATYWVGWNGESPVRVKLADFEAWISQEAVCFEPDGVTQTRIYEIQGQTEAGALPTVQIEYSEFEELGWIGRCWGASATVRPEQGRKAKLRYAIQKNKLCDRRRVARYSSVG